MNGAAWLKEVVLLIFIATTLELLLPDGMLHKFVRMVMGLFVLVSLVNPLAHLLHEDALLRSWQLSMGQEKAEAVMAYGQAMAEEQERKNREAYVHNLQQQITALVYLIDGVEMCETKVELKEQQADDGGTEIARVILTVNEEANREEMIRLIAMYYQFSQEQIEVRKDERRMDCFE